MPLYIKIMTVVSCTSCCWLIWDEFLIDYRRRLFYSYLSISAMISNNGRCAGLCCTIINIHLCTVHFVTFVVGLVLLPLVLLIDCHQAALN